MELKKVKITELISKEVKENSKKEKETQIEIEDENETYFGDVVRKETIEKVMNIEEKNHSKLESKSMKEPTTKVIKKSQTAQSLMPNAKLSELPTIIESDEIIKVKKIRKIPQEKTYVDEKGYLSINFIND